MALYGEHIGVSRTTAATTHSPAQLDNESGDLLMLWVTCVNTAGPTISTPAGWTQEENRIQDDTRCALFWKQSTGGETFPDVTISLSVEANLTSHVFTDVDFVSGPFGDKTVTQTTGNQPWGSVTTTQDNSVLAYWMGMHRRNPGLNASNGTVNTELEISGQTGTTSNGDTSYTFALDYAISTGSTLNPPRPSQSEDNVKVSLEILTNGTIVPALISDDVVGSNIPSITNNVDPRDRIMASGYTQRGVIQNYDFADTDVNSASNQITITGHGIDEAWVVQVDANGATLDSGLTDGGYYYVKPIDVNTVQLVDANGDTDSNAEYYVNGTSFKAVTGLNGDGSGTCRLRDCGFVYSNSGNNIHRFPAGAASNTTAGLSGAWVGNSAGPNRIGYGREFTASRDMSSDTVYCTLQYGSSTAPFNEQGLMFLDSSNEWFSIDLLENQSTAVRTFGNAARPTIIMPADDLSDANGYKSSGGAYNAASTDFVIFYNDGFSSTSQGQSNNNVSALQFFNAPTIYGGSTANPITFADCATAVLEKLGNYFAETPSDSQTVFRIPVNFGGAGFPINLDEDAKSVAVPSLGDGFLDFRIYTRTLPITFDVQSGNTLNMTNTAIASSNFLSVETHNIDAGASFNANGRLFVNLSPVLDADVTYDRPNFVGCDFITHNGATITNGSFDVSVNVGADNGLVNYASSVISNSAFSANTNLTSGHAIIITTPGTYSFANLTFVGFGLDETVTAAVYNNSGGSVIINVSGGSTPTVRNGVGATTNVISGATLTITGVPSGGILTIYDDEDPDPQDLGTTLQVANPTNGSDVIFTHSKGGDNIVIQYIQSGFVEVNQLLTLSSQDQSFDISSFIEPEVNI